MIEHRLIEKMLGLVERELETIKQGKMVDPGRIDAFIDFIRTYADRTHHGKEEDILFARLENKKLDEADAAMMRLLIGEHITARKAVKELVEAKNGYARGDKGTTGCIIEKLSFLIEFYPQHISREDRVFFPNTEKYFSESELKTMVNDFFEFDRKMIHEKYEKLYESLRAVP